MNTIFLHSWTKKRSKIFPFRIPTGRLRTHADNGVGLEPILEFQNRHTLTDRTGQPVIYNTDIMGTFSPNLTIVRIQDPFNDF